MEAKLLPLLIMHDLAKDCFVVPLKNKSYALLESRSTRQQIDEGIFEEVRRNEEAIVYGSTPEMTSIDLHLLLTKDVVAEIISYWAHAAIDFEVARYKNLDVLVNLEELPLTLSVRWSLLGVEPMSMPMDDAATKAE